MNIKFLGASGSKSTKSDTTCIYLNESTIIDAGNIMKAVKIDKLKFINNIYVTHAHLDHIVDIPFLIEATLEDRDEPLNIYGNKQTIEILKNNIFNWLVWPDFSQIPLIKHPNINSLKFIEIECSKNYHINKDTFLTPIEVLHTIDTNGYIITTNNNSILFTSDTYLCNNITSIINKNKNIHTIIVDVSFPSRFGQLAEDSKHLTPKLLKEMIKSFNRKIDIYIYHLKFPYQEEIIKELEPLNVTILKTNDEIQV